MRVLLLALATLLAAAPSAQTTASPVAQGFALLLPADASILHDAAFVPLDPGAAAGDIRTGMLTAGLGTVGGLLGGGASVLGVYLFDDCSAFGCSPDSAVRGLYAPAWVVGGAVGTTAMVWVLGRDGNPAVRRDDWKRALVGVGVGTAAGVALMASVPGVDDPDGPLWPIIAVPVLQGLGAGVAVSLR